ncbi:MAG: DUF2799 domain-containing protein [Pseudomonadota bacterium]
MRSLQITTVLAPVVWLGACAANSPCERGDWYGLGEDDGRRGTLVAVDHHAATCDLDPNPTAEKHYAAGLAAGLERYCNPRNAFERGVDGEDIGDYCVGRPSPAAQKAHAIGLEQRALRVDLARIAAEQAVQQKLRKSVNGSLLAAQQTLTTSASGSMAYTASLGDVRRLESELGRVDQRLATLAAKREAAEALLRRHRRDADRAIAQLH